MSTPTTDGLDHDTRRADYRLDWETDTESGAMYGDDLDTLTDLAEHMRTEHGAAVEIRGWDEYTQGFNAGVAE